MWLGPTAHGKAKRLFFTANDLIIPPITQCYTYNSYRDPASLQVGAWVSVWVEIRVRGSAKKVKIRTEPYKGTLRSLNSIVPPEDCFYWLAMVGHSLDSEGVVLISQV